MSTVFRAPSQVRPNAYYRAAASAQLYTETGANASTVPINSILEDMGKTVHMGDDILRKVKAMDSGNIGYIYLAKAGGVSQNIAAL